MNKYYNYDKDYIGTSDIASLTLRSCNKLHDLHFAEDNSYKAYIVDEEAVIGEHYELVFKGEHWLKIYDDTNLVNTYKAKEINVYRAGDFGCIIQLINKTEE